MGKLNIAEFRGVFILLGLPALTPNLSVNRTGAGSRAGRLPLR